ncbi:MAG: Npt1/Npt2 family nucleotide transporter [Acidobacteriota bacterium]
MVSSVARFFGLSPRELLRALPLFAYLFLTIASTVASKAARDALFLDRFDATALPYVDIAIALLVGVAVSLYIRAGAHAGLRNLQIASLAFFAVTAVGFWLAAGDRAREEVLFVVIYIWVGVLGVLAPMQVWTLSNYVMTTREAKRAFGLIGAGAILGWIVGGLATSLTVGRFGTESMLLAVAAMLTACIGLVVYVWRHRPDYLKADARDVAEPAGAEAGWGGIWGSLALVRESPYLKAIAAVIWLSAFATTIAGWQFKAISKAHISDTDELAAFFGVFNVVAGLASLGLQLLFTSRLLKNAGVGVALFVVPVALMVGSVGVLVLGSLLAVSALKASDQVLRYSIDKVTVELLYLPVPAALTFRVKAFIDTVVYRFGDALGGLAVLVFAAWLGLTPVQMAWVCLVVLGVWIAAAIVARRQYVANLQDTIHQHRVDTERATAPLIERVTADLLGQQLAGGLDEVLHALGVLEMAADRATHPALPRLLRHESPEVRRRACALLARAGDTSVAQEVERLLYDDHLEVRTEALLYLTEHLHVDPLERIEQLGDFADFSLRAAMAAFLARPGKAQNLDAARLILARMVEEPGPEGQRTRLEAARLLAHLPDVFDRELRLLLQDEDVEIARAAIEAVGALRKRAFVPRVLERLGEPRLTGPAAATLAGFGDRIVGTLRDAMVDESMPIAVRRELPLVLQEIGSRSAQFSLLESVLDGDTVLRYRVITALNKLGQLHPERQVDRKVVETVLAAEIMGHYRSYQVLGTLGASLDDEADPVVRGLRESMAHEAERIFRLLKIMYPDADMHSAHVGLQSRDVVVRDNTIEFLENILSPPLRSVLLPLFDRAVSAKDRAKMANRLIGAPLGGREEAIEVMRLSSDPWLQSCAAYAIGEFRLIRFAEDLDRWAVHPDPLLQAAAIDAREKLKRVAAADAGVGMI